MWVFSITASHSTLVSNVAAFPCLPHIPRGALLPEPWPQASWVWVVRQRAGRELRYPGAQEAGKLLTAPGTGSYREVSDV